MWGTFEELMNSRNLRMSDVARETGIPYSTFTDWKVGRSVPKADKMQKIADFFGVTVDYLMTGKAKDGYYLNPETAKAAQEMFENEELRVLFDAARDASPEDLRTVYSLLLALKRKEQPND